MDYVKILSWNRAQQKKAICYYVFRQTVTSKIQSASIVSINHMYRQPAKLTSWLPNLKQTPNWNSGSLPIWPARLKGFWFRRGYSVSRQTSVRCRRSGIKGWEGGGGAVRREKSVWKLNSEETCYLNGRFPKFFHDFHFAKRCPDIIRHVAPPSTCIFNLGSLKTNEDSSQGLRFGTVRGESGNLDGFRQETGRRWLK